jgi:hypothetical protein
MEDLKDDIIISTDRIERLNKVYKLFKYGPDSASYLIEIRENALDDDKVVERCNELLKRLADEYPLS